MTATVDELLEALNASFADKADKRLWGSLRGVVSAFDDFEKKCAAGLTSVAKHVAIAAEIRHSLQGLLGDFHVESERCSDDVGLALFTLDRMEVLRSHRQLTGENVLALWKGLAEALDADGQSKGFAECAKMALALKEAITKTRAGAEGIEDGIHHAQKQGSFWWKGFSVGFVLGAAGGGALAAADGVLGAAGTIAIPGTAAVIAGTGPVALACVAIATVVGLLGMLAHKLWQMYKNSKQADQLRSLEALILKLDAFGKCADDLRKHAGKSEVRTKSLSKLLGVLNKDSPAIADLMAETSTAKLRSSLTTLQRQLADNATLSLPKPPAKTARDAAAAAGGLCAAGATVAAASVGGANPVVGAAAGVAVGVMTIRTLKKRT